MIGVVLVAHGGQAREWLATVDYVVGKQENIRTVSFGVNDNLQAKSDEICAAAASVDDGAGVALVVDMFGASPSNLTLPACDCKARKVVFGANLPLIIQLAKSRHLPLDVAVDEAIAAGRDYIGIYNDEGKIIRP